MIEFNPLFDALDDILSNNAIITQCIIKDYAVDNNKATCTAIVPNILESDTSQNNTQTNNEVLEFKNVNCYIGSAIDLTFENYMQGILIKLQNPYTTAQEISEQKETKFDGYFNICSENLIAIIIPHCETLTNILTYNITSKDKAKIQSDTLYLGNKDTNILKELSTYLDRLKTFFENLSTFAPNISSYPADGSAKLQKEAMEMNQVTKELYDKINPITDYKEEN